MPPTQPNEPEPRHDVVVIGAGPAGLAAAAALQRAGVRSLVVDRADAVGASWRGHYDRLHLHGYRRGLEPLVGHLGVLDARGLPRSHGPRSDLAAPRLRFIGFSNPVSGMFREIAIDARRIARAMQPELAAPAAPGAPGASRPRRRPSARQRIAT